MRCGSPQQNFWQRDPAFSRYSQQDNQRQFEAIGAIGTPKQGRVACWPVAQAHALMYPIARMGHQRASRTHGMQATPMGVGFPWC